MQGARERLTPLDPSSSRLGRALPLGLLGLWLAVPASPAHAGEADAVDPVVTAPSLTAPDDRPEYERRLTPKPLRHARWAALVNGGWSALTTASWIYSARLWDTPQPDGLLSLVAARVLYGTTNSVLLAGELSLFTWLFSDDWHRLSHGRFHNEWWVGLATPTGCSGDVAGCGFGLGGSSELTVRIDGELELAFLSGWIQGRVEDDETRTVLESTWFQGPFVARWVQTYGRGPVRLTTSVGGGVFFGLRMAHGHPKGGARPDGASPLELSVLDGGAGLGFSSRVRLELPGGIDLSLDLDLVPLFGHARAATPSRVRPLLAASGTPIYRRLSFGIGFPKFSDAPVRLSARFATMELSARPLAQTGHWMGILAFDVPFVLEPDALADQ